MGEGPGDNGVEGGLSTPAPPFSLCVQGWGYVENPVENLDLWTTLWRSLWATGPHCGQVQPVDEVVEMLWKSGIIKKTGRLWKTCRLWKTQTPSETVFCGKPRPLEEQSCHQARNQNLLASQTSAKPFSNGTSPNTKAGNTAKSHPAQKVCLLMDRRRGGLG